MPQWIMIHLKPIWTKYTVIMGVTTVFFCLLFSTSLVANAQTASSSVNTVTQGVSVIEKPLGLASTDIRIVVARIIRVALGLLGIIFVLLVIYGGFLYMTAGGNEEQISSAKKVLVNAAVGLAVIMSAYAIVTFVMNSLLNAGGGSGTEGDGSASGISDSTNFYGTGGLGTIIKDHYPGRDQIDIPRNAKIIITFSKPITLSNFISNTNASKNTAGTEIFGDCRNIGQNMVWEKDCDTLKKGANLISIKETLTGQEIRGANVLANVENGKVKTIVIRPFDPIGSDKTKVQYTVHLGSGITWDDASNNNPSIFNGRPSAFYEWKFTADTALDLQPPHVTDVFPARNASVAKNSVIQISFNEAMDPTAVQGAFKAEEKYYVLDGNTVYLQSGMSTVPVGEMRLVNGYKTLEFTPSRECGQNACGGKIFCLPVCDSAGASCKSDVYQMIVKAAQTFTVKSFEALPFSGAMDVSGNALDGNNDGKVQTVIETSSIFPDQQKPDNYFWNFTLKDAIDVTAPYIKQVKPGPDAENVASDAEVAIVFSKRMRVEPMYTIGLDEFPTRAEGLCKVPRVTFNDDGTTLTKIDHCPFVSEDNHFFMPSVDSRIEDVAFNCFYPGKGPISTDITTNVSNVCDNDHPNQCCPVTKEAGNAFCCNGLTNKISKETCLNALSAK